MLVQKEGLGPWGLHPAGCFTPTQMNWRDRLNNLCSMWGGGLLVGLYQPLTFLSHFFSSLQLRAALSSCDSQGTSLSTKILWIPSAHLSIGWSMVLWNPIGPALGEVRLLFVVTGKVGEAAPQLAVNALEKTVDFHETKAPATLLWVSTAGFLVEEEYGNFSPCQDPWKG